MNILLIRHLPWLVTWGRRTTVANRLTDTTQIGHEHSFDTSLAMVGHMGAENNRCKQTDRHYADWS